MSKDRKIIIAFSGFKRSGKDTAANMIVKGLSISEGSYNVANVVIKSFAEPFKNLIEDIFGIYEPEIVDKEAPLKQTKRFFNKPKSYRELVLLLGEGIKKLTKCNNIWTYSMEHSILGMSRYFVTPSVFIIPDVRYNSEFKMLERFKKRGYEVYHYIVFKNETLPEWCKLGLDPNIPEELEIIKNDFEIDHSEYEWCMSPHKFDGWICNDGSLDDLKATIKENIINKIFEEDLS